MNVRGCPTEGNNINQISSDPFNYQEITTMFRTIVTFLALTSACALDVRRTDNTQPLSLADLGLSKGENDVDRMFASGKESFVEKSRTLLRRADPVATSPVTEDAAVAEEPATDVVKQMAEEQQEQTAQPNQVEEEEADPVVALCSPADCNTNGECIDGQCSCNSPWTGPGCDIKGCLNGCSDRGECFNGTCYCYPGSAGQDCSEIACPEDCNNDHGTCSKGNCTCFPSYRGDSCGLLRCPKDCSDHGQFNIDLFVRHHV